MRASAPEPTPIRSSAVYVRPRCFCRVADLAARRAPEKRRPGRRRAALVNDRGGRLEPQPEPLVMKPLAEVHVLGVHEEAVVEAAEGLECVAPQQETRA